jgi:hypothetical protein
MKQTEETCQIFIELVDRLERLLCNYRKYKREGK